MKREEINIFKVVILAELSPASEISMKVFKGSGIERGNSYLITSMGINSGMEDLPYNKVITKSNLMKSEGYGNHNSASVTVWCLEEQIPEAKELCMNKMHEIVKRNLDHATRMSAMFQAYKHESKVSA